MNVLSIEKNPDEKIFLEPILENLNNEYKSCTTISEGIETFLDWRPDLILLDLDFPESSPLELLNIFKEKSGFTQAPVITFALEPSEKTILQAYEMGTTEFIRKPYDLSELVIKIQNLLNSVSLEKENNKIISTLRESKKKLQHDKELLSSYFSEDLMNSLLSGKISTSLGGEIKEVSAFFLHLREAESLLKNLKPEEFSDLLSALFSGISDIINENGGSINKFLGDGILATFGCPYEIENKSLAAVKSAIQIREFLESFNAFRPYYMEKAIHLGMGISKGRVFAGNVGSVNRMEYTVLGDPVNTASRLQYLTDNTPFDIFIDGNIRKDLKNNLDVVRIIAGAIRGKRKNVKIYYPKKLT